jgi:hypothetical protein
VTAILNEFGTLDADLAQAGIVCLGRMGNRYVCVCECVQVAFVYICVCERERKYVCGVLQCVPGTYGQ